MNQEEFRNTHFYRVIQFVVPLLGAYVAWKVTGIWQISVIMIIFAIGSNIVYYFLRRKSQ